MKYKEYIPNHNIQKYIDKFWVASDFETDFNQEVYPEGCTNIVFHLQPNGGQVNFLGIQTKFSEFKPKETDSFYGISFKAGAVKFFTDTNLSTLRNSSILCQDILPTINNDILAEFESKETNQERFKFIEQQLVKVLTSRKKCSSIILHVSESIKRNYKQSSIDLAKAHFISLRQLERKFKAEVGITIKLYTRLVRLNQSIKVISELPDLSLAELSFQLGYYDHAHLSNEFKYFTGKTPAQFK